MGPVRPRFDLNSRVSKVVANLSQPVEGMVIAGCWLREKQSNKERLLRCVSSKSIGVKLAPSAHCKELSSTGPMLRDVMYHNPLKRSHDTPYKKFLKKMMQVG